MRTWKPYLESQGPETWNALLLEAADYTIFQSYEWGEYKRNAGWQPIRYIARDKSGSVIGMVQLLLKLGPFDVGIMWAPGGPVIQFKRQHNKVQNPDFFDLVDILKNKYPRVLIRFHSHMLHNPNAAFDFHKILKRPISKINSGYTIQMDLLLQPEIFKREMTSKHRYYVNKAEQEPLRWKVGNSDEEIDALNKVHREMVVNKNMKFLSISAPEIKNMCSSLTADSVKIVTGYIDEEPVTSCMTLNFGVKSIYMVAATGHVGRKINSAYAMVPKLFETLRDSGIEHFDFGGIDPISPSADGVNHFKKGFGGQVVEYLGEWETCSKDWLRWSLNYAISRRSGRI